MRGSRSVALPGANGTMTWTRLVVQTLPAEVWGGEVCAVSGPTIVHTDAVAATAASTAHLHALRLCTLSSSCARRGMQRRRRRPHDPSRSLFAPPPSRRRRAQAALAREHDISERAR